MHNHTPEFDLIKRYFLEAANKAACPELVLGIGDDCALLQLAADEQLAVSIDTSIAGVHFPAELSHHNSADVIAKRAINVALSDLAAMGARPLAFTLALSLPASLIEHDEAFLADFSQGVYQAAVASNVALMGGDTTNLPDQSPLTISVSVYGAVIKGQELTRLGAQTGHGIFVSGCLGDGAAGLHHYFHQGNNEALLSAYLTPQPRFDVSKQITSVASSCIDVSDGLLSDLQHILSASNKAAVIDVAALPLSAAMRENFADDEARLMALTGGDDYQLCFTADVDAVDASNWAKDVTQIGVIGDVTADCSGPNTAVTLKNLSAVLQQQLKKKSGYDHFQS